MSVQLLGPGTVSEQLAAFKDDPWSDLRSFPLAFTELQERAFTGNSERYGESEHKLVKASMTRGLRLSKPAYTCARKRRPQLERMLKDPVQYDWVIQRWHSRTIFQELLMPKFTRQHIQSRTTAQRHAKVYGYELKTVFEDTVPQQQGILALTAARERVQTLPVVQLSGPALLIVNFLKNHLFQSGVFAVSSSIFNAAIEPMDIENLEQFGEGVLLDALEGRVMEEGSELDLTYFLVVDPRPENRFAMRTAQVSKVSSMVDVKVLKVIALSDPIALSTDGESCRLDLAAWCSGIFFHELMGNLRMYSAVAGNMQVKLDVLCDSGHAPSVRVVPPESAFGAGDDDHFAVDPFSEDAMGDALAVLAGCVGDGLDVAAAGVAAVAPAGDADIVMPDAAGAGALVLAVEPTRTYRSGGHISSNAVPLFQELVEGKHFSENGAESQSEVSAASVDPLKKLKRQR